MKKRIAFVAIAANVCTSTQVTSSSQTIAQPIISGSLLSEENLERCANLYAEQENNVYTNDYYGYYNGAKQMGNAILNEIQRRQLLIKSEPDGIVRETMINNLLLDI